MRRHSRPQSRCPRTRRLTMSRSFRMLALAAVGCGAALGWLVATDQLAGQTAAAQPVQAQPTAGGTQLPQPDPAFKGKIAETYKASTPSYPQPVKAAKGVSNVLVILLDDVGFGHTSTFGGPVPTPTLDRLAKGG